MRTQWDEIWRFDTARFSIVGSIAPDDQPWDGEGPAPEGSAFLARVAVYFENEEELGSDVLGGCWYDDPRDFFRVESIASAKRDARKAWRDAMARKQLDKAAEARRELARWHDLERRGVLCGSYFTGMVHEAIAEARKTIARRREAYGRIRV